jgi:predicted membrane-bound mannosyltransferase
LTTLTGVYEMTTKSKSSKAKPALLNNIVAKAEHVALATEAGSAALESVTMRTKCNDACKALHKGKAKVGQARSCQLAKAFLAARCQGKKIAASTKAFYLSAFRKAVESGADYNENASRAKAKAKAVEAKAAEADEADEVEDTEPQPVIVQKPAKDDETTIILALPRKANAKDATRRLNVFIEKMRQSDALADLAAYLTDAIEEFNGSAK